MIRIIITITITITIIIYNDNKKCILKYEKENFIITYKYLTEIQEDYGVSILYTILPFTN